MTIHPLHHDTLSPFADATEVLRDDQSFPSPSGWNAYHEIDTANECLLFLISAMFGSDAGCAAKGEPCAKIHEVIVFLRRRFAREEEVMRAVQYPATDRHLVEHEIVLDRLERMYRFLKCGSYDSRLVVEFVQSWATDHIELFDKPLGRFLVSHGAETDVLSRRPPD